MSFYEKLEMLCKNRGITVTALAKELGYSSSAGTTWKKSKGLPRNSTIKKITDYFEIPITYFSDGTVDVQSVQDNHGIIGHAHAPVTILNDCEAKMSEQETALLNIFKKLDVIKQAQLLAYAAELEKGA